MSAVKAKPAEQRKVTLTIWIDIRLYEKLYEIAQSRGISLSALGRELLEKALEAEKK